MIYTYKTQRWTLARIAPACSSDSSFPAEQPDMSPATCGVYSHSRRNTDLNFLCSHCRTLAKFFLFPPSYHIVLICLVIVHTIFIRHLLVSPPPNIFTQLRIHINTPTDTIRHALVQHTHPVFSTGSTSPIDTTLPDHIESLINRLRSLEARSLYIRCVLHTHLNLPVSSAFNQIRTRHPCVTAPTAPPHPILLSSLSHTHYCSTFAQRPLSAYSR